MANLSDQEFSEDFMQQGWNQMREMLDEHDARRKRPFVFRMSGYRMLIAASVLLLTLLSGVYYHFAGRGITSLQSSVQHVERSTEAKTAKKMAPIYLPATGVRDKGESAIFIGKEEQRYLLGVQNVEVKRAVFDPENESRGVQAGPIPSVPFSDSLPEPGLTDGQVPILRPVSEGADSARPVTRRKHQRPGIYLGAGFNFSGPKALSLQRPSVHPMATISFPLYKQLSLDAGIGGFSSINRKNENAVIKEYVNSLADNVYYKVYTTDLIRVSYIDVPVTLNYTFASGISVGTGFQLSRLYNSRVSEKKESFGFAGELQEMERNTFSTNSTNFGAFPRQVELMNWDSRLLLQAGFTSGRTRISAKYLHGLGPAVEVLQSDGSKHDFRNSFVGIDIQFLINKR